MSSSRQPLARIFAVPALVAVISAAGLAGALVGDGIWDWLSSICLAIPPVIFLACVSRRKPAAAIQYRLRSPGLLRYARNDDRVDTTLSTSSRTSEARSGTHSHRKS
jgi:hypothetical protein